MATFFGEVILPSSRVFFDNDDSDFEDDNALQNSSCCNNLEVVELLPDSLSGDYDLLIITEGVVAKGFADNYLLEQPVTPIAEVKMKQDESKEPADVTEAKPPKTQPSFIYSLENNSRLLSVSQAIDLTLANTLLLSLQDFVQKSKFVVVLCNRPSADFRCDSINDLPPSFIRMLTTTNLQPPPNCKVLEQPNFISGFAASVISLCECLRKNCQLYIAYTDKTISDSVTLGPFVDLFAQSEELKGLSKRRSSAKIASPSDQSFMYM